MILTTVRRMAWRTKWQDSVFKVMVGYSRFSVTMSSVAKSKQQGIKNAVQGGVFSTYSDPGLFPWNTILYSD